MPTEESTEIYSNLSDDADMTDLIVEFVKCLRERADALEAAVGNNNLTEIVRLAHQLRGASGGYGFDGIGLSAGELEDAGRAAQSAEQVRKELEALTQMCRRAQSSCPPA